MNLFRKKDHIDNHPALDGLKKFDKPDDTKAYAELQARRAENKIIATAAQVATSAYLNTHKTEPYVRNSDVQAVASDARITAQNAITKKVEQVASSEDADVDQSGITTKELV